MSITYRRVIWGVGAWMLSILILSISLMMGVGNVGIFRYIYVSMIIAFLLILIFVLEDKIF